MSGGKRMRLFNLRPDPPEELPEPVHMPEIDHTGPSFVTNADDVPTSSVHWERTIPVGDLVGWRVQVVYPYSAGGEEGSEPEELRWAEGFVTAFQRLGGASRVMIHVYFDEDEFDAHFSLPDLDVAFHTAGRAARVSQVRVRAAQAASDGV